MATKSTQSTERTFRALGRRRAGSSARRETKQDARLMEDDPCAYPAPGVDLD